MSARYSEAAASQIAPQKEERNDVGGGRQVITQFAAEMLSPPVFESLVPSEIKVGHLPHPSLRVHAPFSIRFSADQDHVVAEAQVFNEFGFGANASEALDDVQHAIVELFFELEAMQDRLGPDLLAVRDALRSHITKLS